MAHAIVYMQGRIKGLFHFIAVVQIKPVLPYKADKNGSVSKEDVAIFVKQN